MVNTIFQWETVSTSFRTRVSDWGQESYNIYTEEENSWGFLARPEAGILVRIGTRRKLGLMAAVHYDFSTSKSVNYGYDNFMNAGFQVGIMLMQW